MGIRCNAKTVFGWLVGLGVLAILLLPANALQAQQLESGEASAAETDHASGPGVAVVGMPIETGWVVLDGALIEPPYIIGRQGRDITLNGQRVMTQDADGGREGLRRREGRGEGRAERGHADQDRRRQRGGQFGAARIEHQLNSGNLIVMATDVGAATIGRISLPEFVEALASDESAAEKADALGRLVQRPAHSALWVATLEGYRPDARLSQAAAIVQEEAERREREKQAESARVGFFNWVMPMAAIGAVLAGLGVLLHVHRHGLKEPGSYRVWRHVDTSGRRSRVVFLLIILLLLLNGLDLAFTIIAQQTGQFAELSPIGDRLISTPMLLGMYKVAAVGLGVGLLFYLRQRRAAEVAAWWMCALYVLVLVRWAAVNTLIMA